MELLKLAIICIVLVENSTPSSFIGPSSSFASPLLTELKQYAIVIPHQAEDPHARLKKRDLSTELNIVPGIHSKQTYFSFKFENQTFILELKLNEELLPKDFSTSIHTDDGQVIMDKPNLQERNHCYYQGHVVNMERSHVIMSTCDGLRGCIALSDDFLLIEPLSPHSTQHVVYRPKDQTMNEVDVCGNQDAGHADVNVGSFAGMLRQNEQHRHKREATTEKKFLELLVVADKAQAAKYSRVELDTRIKELVNYINGFYKKLKIHVVLSHIEVWKTQDKIPPKTNAQEVLNEFLSYRQSKISSEPSSSYWKYTDNAQLLYGGSFEGSTIGMASVKTMCTSRSGGVNQDHQANVFYTATTLAHEMGHNFGMHHDSASCDCPPGTQCLMASSSGSSFKKEWSSCSKEYLAQSITEGLGNCLLNVPDPSRLYGGPKCGNDIIEMGEDCDCGGVDECLSRCCNATTCKLILGASCDTGPCCLGCQYSPAGQICRDTNNNICDLAEYCTGTSANCPGNVYRQNGSPCNNNQAACAQGVCLTHDLQCQGIWGEEAVSGNDICYERVNKLGNWNGNCGRGTSGFIKCTKEDSKCGKLQCSGGGDRPIVARDRYAFKNTIERKYECKTISSDDNATDVSDPGLVRDGTRCGDGKICNDGKCDDLPTMTCDATCNGHGVCNNLGNCHCNRGWAPPFCSSEGNGGSVNSGPITSNTMDTQTILMLVMFLVVFPIVVGSGLFIWYRYCSGRSQVESWKKGRKDRLEAVARAKKSGGKNLARTKDRVTSNSEEQLFDNDENDVEFRTSAVKKKPVLGWDSVNQWNDEPASTQKPVPIVMSMTKPTPPLEAPKIQNTPTRPPPPHPIAPSQVSVTVTPVRSAPPPPLPPPVEPQATTTFASNQPHPPRPPPPPAITKPPNQSTSRPTFPPPPPTTKPPLPPVGKPPVSKKPTPEKKPIFKPLVANKSQFHGSNPILASTTRPPPRKVLTQRPHSGGELPNNAIDPSQLSVQERMQRFGA
ncbi:zinc metalloproteinase-disintegrin-like NaMP isoform X1 [Ciona intestinalis]